MFTHRIAGKTPVTRTGGTHVASESLKGRVFTVRCAGRPARARPQPPAGARVVLPASFGPL